MPEGTCQVCRKAADLQDSHLLPKAIYRLSSKAGDKNPNPVFVDGKIAMKTSRQVKAHLLCRVCEGLFSLRGEDWVLRNCWRGEQEFRIREAFGAYDGSGVKTIATSGNELLDGDALTYFAASVFWRGAIQEWQGPVAGHRVLKLELGPYEERLRLYLLGEARFPKDAALLVSVSSLTARGANGIIMLPAPSSRTPTYRRHTFIIPGIRFDLLTGRAMPSGFKALCIAHGPGHPIHMSRSTDEASVRGMRKFARAVRRVGDPN